MSCMPELLSMLKSDDDTAFAAVFDDQLQQDGREAIGGLLHDAVAARAWRIVSVMADRVRKFSMGFEVVSDWLLQAIGSIGTRAKLCALFGNVEFEKWRVEACRIASEMCVGEKDKVRLEMLSHVLLHLGDRQLKRGGLSKVLPLWNISLDMLDALAKAGFDFNASHTKTPLNPSDDDSRVLIGLRNLIDIGCNWEVVISIVERGALVDYGGLADEGFTFLHYLAEMGHQEPLQRILKCVQANLNVRENAYGMTPLHSACFAVPFEHPFAAFSPEAKKRGIGEDDIYRCIEVLVRNGADLEVRDTLNRTPLAIACQVGDGPVYGKVMLGRIKVLLALGADRKALVGREYQPCESLVLEKYGDSSEVYSLFRSEGS